MDPRGRDRGRRGHSLPGFRADALLRGLLDLRLPPDVPGGGDVVVAGVPSGEQFSISRGEQRATNVEVGGGVREYRDGGRDVLDPLRAAATCDGGPRTDRLPLQNRHTPQRY